MEIVRIFNGQLFAFHFKGEKFNEMQRLLTLWNDTAYLYEFVTKNKSDIPKDLNILALVSQLIDHTNDIDDSLYEISSNPEPMAMEVRKPIFLLKHADGAIGAHYQAVLRAYVDFKMLTSKILERTKA